MASKPQVSEVSPRSLQAWLRIPAGAKPQVYRQVFATAEIDSVKYWLEVFFSAGIATFGLVENSPAVIIGAMLISPSWAPSWPPDWPSPSVISISASRLF